jgi:hypothetical protein
MTTTEAQQLDLCARAMRRAQEAMVLDDPRRIAALLAARDEIDATIRTLRWRPRPHPAALALLTVCIGLFTVVGIETVRLLTAVRPAVEVRK